MTSRAPEESGNAPPGGRPADARGFIDERSLNTRPIYPPSIYEQSIYYPGNQFSSTPAGFMGQSQPSHLYYNQPPQQEYDYEDEKAKKKKGWKKPEDMPKRPLSAYNLFFREERKRLLGDDLAKEYEIEDQSKRKHRKSHGKIGFKEMAQTISSNWKKLPEEKKQPFVDAASKEQARYKLEMKAYKEKQDEKDQKAESERRQHAKERKERAEEGVAALATQSAVQARAPQTFVEPTSFYPRGSGGLDGSLRSIGSLGSAGEGLHPIPPSMRSPSLPLGVMQPMGSSDYAQEINRRRRQLELYELHLAQAAQLREEIRRGDGMSFVPGGGYDDLGMSLSSRGGDPMNLSGRGGYGAPYLAGTATGMDRLLQAQRAEMEAMNRNRQMSAMMGQPGMGAGPAHYDAQVAAGALHAERLRAQAQREQAAASPRQHQRSHESEKQSPRSPKK